MPDYIHRDDPGLLPARQEIEFDLFLKAIEELAPEIIDGLTGAPFEAFRKVANEYKTISSYEFGWPEYQRDGQRICNARPLGNLALLISSPDGQVEWNDWPPSAPFRQLAMQESVSELLAAMGEWAANFLNVRGYPSFGLVNTGLDTMLQWLGKPDSRTSAERLERTKAFFRRSIPPPRYQIQIDGWSPRDETEKQFNERFKRHLNELNLIVKDHVRAMKRQLVKLNVKRNPAHFQWAALRLARKMSYPEIADARGGDKLGSLDQDTVRKGVKAVLNILKLSDVKTSSR